MMIVVAVMMLIVSCGEDPFFHNLVIKNDEGKTITTIVVPDGDYKLPEKVDGLEGIEGWIYEDKEYSVGDVISVTKDSEITAITGTVIMVDNGDGTTQRVVVKKGETTLTLPKTPAERSGYVFDGWLVNGTLKEASATVEYTEGMKIEAKWTVVYTITYDANGGTGTVAPTLLRADAESVEISGNTGFSKNGLFFSSWNTQADGKGTIYKKGDTYNKKENITLYAIWTDFITVTYYNGTKLVGEDAGKPADLTLRAGSTLTAPTGTEFDAWYTKIDFTGECYSDNKALTESVTLYAHFVDSNLDYSIAGAVKAKDTNSITSVTIPSVYKGTPITMIAANGFQNSSVLKTVAMENPSSLTTISNYAFSGCSVLTSVELPSTLTTIGNYAFSGCGVLTTVNLPSSLRTISNYAFQNCGKLTSLTLPNGLTTLKDDFIAGTGITSIDVPASVTSYSNYVFHDAGNLKSVEFKGVITSITTSMFSACGSLESIIIPDGLTSISGNAFLNCSKLEQIYLPQSVTSIADDAFKGCTKLETINIDKNKADAGSLADKKWGASNANVRWRDTVVVSFTTGEGGTVVDDQYLTVGDKITKPADPTRSGYTFVKWTDGNGNDIDFDTYTVTRNIILVAQWTETK